MVHMLIGVKCAETGCGFRVSQPPCSHTTDADPKVRSSIELDHVLITILSYLSYSDLVQYSMGDLGMVWIGREHQTGRDTTLRHAPRRAMHT